MILFLLSRVIYEVVRSIVDGIVATVLGNLSRNIFLTKDRLEFFIRVPYPKVVIL